MATSADIPVINGVATPVSMQDRPKVYGWPTPNKNGYTIGEVPSGSKQRKKITVIGAGASDFGLLIQNSLMQVLGLATTTLISLVP